jgi:hypothetical protein
MKTSKSGNTHYFDGGMWLGSDGSVCIAHRGTPKFCIHVRKGSKQFARLVKHLKKTSTAERVAIFENRT